MKRFNILEMLKGFVFGFVFLTSFLFSNIVIYLLRYFFLYIAYVKKRGVKPNFDLTNGLFKFTFERPFVYLYFIAFMILIYSIYKMKRRFKTLDMEEKGRSRFTTLKEIKEQYIEIDEKDTEVEGYGGFPISRYKDKIYIDTNTTHNLIIGTTRSKKAEDILFPYIDIRSRAKEKPSIIALDPKGEFAASTAETLQKRGYNVEVLNFLQPTKSMYWNPLNLIKNALKRGDYPEAVSLCNTFSYSIFKNDKEAQKDPYWSDAGISLLNGVIISLSEKFIEKKEEFKITMYTMVKFIVENQDDDKKDKNNIKNKLNDYIDSLPISSEGRLQFSTFRISDGKTRMGVLSVALSKLMLFLMNDIAQMTGSNSVELENAGFNTDKLYTLKVILKNSFLENLFKKEKIELLYKENEEVFFENKELDIIKKAFLDLESLNLKLFFKLREKAKKALFTTEELIFEMKSVFENNLTKEQLENIEEQEILKENNLKEILKSLYIKGYINNPERATLNFKFNISKKFKLEENLQFKFRNTILSLIEDEEYKSICEKVLDVVEKNTFITTGIYPLKKFNETNLSLNEKIVMKIITERFLEYIDEVSILVIKMELDYHIPFVFEENIELNLENYRNGTLRKIYDFLSEKVLEKYPNQEIENFEKLNFKKTVEYLETLFFIISNGKDTFLQDLKEEKEVFFNEKNIVIEKARENKPTAIFVIIPDFDKSRHILATYFISQLYFILAKKANLSDKQKCDRRVYIDMDEFGNMPLFNDMDNMATVSLSRDIIFTFAIQSLSQLEKYKEAGKIIKENCGNTIYLLSSDKETREEISANCGNKTIISTSLQKETGDILSKSSTDTTQDHRLIKPEDLLRLSEDEAIIIRFMKRTDLKGRKIEPFAIYNTGKTSYKPRYKYLLDTFPQGNNINTILKKLYGYREPINLDELRYEE
ncbi:MAG: type IV secretory system conjugative DNA transfer family protein [Parvimonas sp.]|uniref:VirD4-like conjugal transfer protein, CD1115 family n=1 Tax=Parvimonas sp. TaxID=1944660 RepID=UPI002A748D8E|nr:type IV secretory system conjugative DNA transfer family protein [Parvimonas sp.]MDY3050712.1 type IV secretory system conjugative DNA transfer family protein [Parvimonas sp.]